MKFLETMIKIFITMKTQIKYSKVMSLFKINISEVFRNYNLVFYFNENKNKIFSIYELVLLFFL